MGETETSIQTVSHIGLVVNLVAYRLPLWVASAALLVIEPRWSSIAIAAAMLFDRKTVLSLVLLGIAYRPLGAPLGLVLIFGVAAHIYGPLVRTLGRLLPALLPGRVSRPARRHKCRHVQAMVDIDTLIASGCADAALDASLALLASHPAQPARCLQGALAQAAELAMAANAPYLAEVLARRVGATDVRMDGWRHARGNLVLGWSLAAQGDSAGAASALDVGLKTARGNRMLQRRLRILGETVRVLSTDTATDDALIAFMKHRSGLGRGLAEAAFVAAPLYARAGNPAVAAELWGLARAATNLDRRPPQGSAAAPRGRAGAATTRWCLTVAGAVEASAQLGEPSESLLAGATVAAEILLAQGSSPQAQACLAAVAAGHLARGDMQAAATVAQMAIKTENMRAYVVMDWSSATGWQDAWDAATRTARAAGRETGAGVPLIQGTGLIAARKGIAIAQALVEGPTQVSDSTLVDACTKTASALLDADDPNEALGAADIITEVYTKRERAGKSVPPKSWGPAHRRRAQCLEALDRQGEALAAWESAARCLRLAAPTNPVCQESCAVAVLAKAQNLVRVGEDSAAALAAVEAVRRWEAIAPTSAFAVRRCTTSFDVLRDIHRRAQRRNATFEVTARAVAALRRVESSETPGRIAAAEALPRALGVLAGEQHRANQKRNELDTLLEAARRLEHVHPDSPVQAKREKRAILGRLATRLTEYGYFDAAMTHLDTWEAFANADPNESEADVLARRIDFHDDRAECLELGGLGNPQYDRLAAWETALRLADTGRQGTLSILQSLARKTLSTLLDRDDDAAAALVLAAAAEKLGGFDDDPWLAQCAAWVFSESAPPVALPNPKDSDEWLSDKSFAVQCGGALVLLSNGRDHEAIARMTFACGHLNTCGCMRMLRDLALAERRGGVSRSGAASIREALTAQSRSLAERWELEAERPIPYERPPKPTPRDDGGTVRDMVSSAAAAASALATHLGLTTFGPEFLLPWVLSDDNPLLERLMRRTGVSVASITEDLASLYGAKPRATPESPPATPSEEVGGILGATSDCQSPDDGTPRAITVLERLLAHGGVAATLCAGYGLTPDQLQTLVDETGEALPDEPTLPDSWAEDPTIGPLVLAASPIVSVTLREAAARAARAGRAIVDVDDVGDVVLNFKSEVRTRIWLALRSLDVEAEKVRRLFNPEAAARARDGRRSRVPGWSENLASAVADLPRWVARTGEVNADSAHLVLSVFHNFPNSETATSLAFAGLTPDLLTVAVVNTREGVGDTDMPRRYSRPTTSTRGPRPSVTARPANSEAPKLRDLATRLRTTVFRSNTLSGINMNSDLQLRRVSRVRAVIVAEHVLALTRVAATVLAAHRANDLWLLATLVGLGPTPMVVPTPVYLAGEAVCALFVPWYLRAIIVALVATRLAHAWMSVQFRRADVGDPTYGLRRLRRDSFRSNSALLLGWLTTPDR